MTRPLLQQSERGEVVPDEPRIHWPEDAPPTGALVVWRGGMGHPPDKRWTRRYVPEVDAHELAEALMDIRRYVDEERCPLVDSILSRIDRALRTGTRNGEDVLDAA